METDGKIVDCLLLVEHANDLKKHYDRLVKERKA